MMKIYHRVPMVINVPEANKAHHTEPAKTNRMTTNTW